MYKVELRPCGGKGQLELEAVGTPRQAMRWPPRNRWNDALDAQICTPPTLVGLGIIAPIGQQTGQGQPGNIGRGAEAFYRATPARFVPRCCGKKKMGLSDCLILNRKEKRHVHLGR
jgi:hypothetical protein